MVELGLVKPLTDNALPARMLHNDSHRFESGFVGVDVRGGCVMLDSLKGSKLGVWVAHGEGKFSLPAGQQGYNIVLRYSHPDYPTNPNGSDFGAAGIASEDGRHVAMMPHPERALKPWNWAHYPEERVHTDEVSPWVEAFVNARRWIEEKLK